MVGREGLEPSMFLPWLFYRQLPSPLGHLPTYWCQRMVSNHLSRGFNPLLCHLSYTGLSSHMGPSPCLTSCIGKAPIPACWVAVRCVYYTMHLVICQQGKKMEPDSSSSTGYAPQRHTEKKVPRPAATDWDDCRKEEMKGITMPKPSVTIFYHTISSGVNPGQPYCLWMRR